MACLAPWEGWSDLYNDDVMRGGIPAPQFQQEILNDSSPNRGRAEDVVAMVQKYPLWNQYWEDRRAKLNRINVPLYVTASWTNLLHTRGTFKGWSEVASKEKWLRVHNSHEWPDLYYPQNTEDLRRFFDCYLKGVDNDWKFTPRVRMCVLNPGSNDVINRPEKDFPIPRRKLRKMFLDCAQQQLWMEEEVPEHTSVRFDGPTGKVEFVYIVPDHMELTGFFALKVWVEAIGSDDVDLFVKVSKLSPNGQLLESMCIDPGYLQPDGEGVRQRVRDEHLKGNPMYDLYFAEGSTGRLRASHRELDESKWTPDEPVYTHRGQQKLGPGEIVPMVIEMWPHGMIWQAGERLRLTVAGYNTRPEHKPNLKPPTYNKGEIVIHAGGRYDSHLLVPFIPVE